MVWMRKSPMVKPWQAPQGTGWPNWRNRALEPLHGALARRLPNQNWLICSRLMALSALQVGVPHCGMLGKVLLTNRRTSTRPRPLRESGVEQTLHHQIV